MQQQEEVKTIEHLPEVVLEKVFGYLSPKLRKETMLVCKR